MDIFFSSKYCYKLPSTFRMIIREEIYHMTENYCALQNRFGSLKFIRKKLMKNVPGELEIHFLTYLCTGKDLYKLYRVTDLRSSFYLGRIHGYTFTLIILSILPKIFQNMNFFYKEENNTIVARYKKNK